MDFNWTRFGQDLDKTLTSISRLMDATPENSVKKSFGQAVQEYDGLSKLFRQLMPFKDGIAELRLKKASYTTIADLLNGEGIAVSARTIERFHRQFDDGESRLRRKKRPIVPAPGVNQKPPANSAEKQPLSAQLEERRAKLIGPWTPRKRGPRIADVKNL